MIYILLIFVKREVNKVVGKLGVVKFSSGYYAYVGSAKLNFEHRIKRHLLKKKKLFWHIDYLLNSKGVEIKKVFYSDGAFEHETARKMSIFGFKAVKGFGSSDCNCLGHLFYVDDEKKFESLIKGIGFNRYI
ncbi:Uri superfamily endonuclease [Candidatus Kryptonium thompsonii]|jgi:Uri superfamily endonuclease|uniref:Uri superfamily endonuclease n=1 Tax=Candidatus Kryptonium thompsonii TaxID=1633631 RepID=A0A0P1L8Y0_9BACT|nr:GIY-YIG nuclease family protein [Candidatus Kryptonium thompsoni]CUS77102.1 Uri superfamily endonuclease [Candidatus Kryptonium thompsoni]CUS78804.1 Uri superfamily endonuclease [Candidatus Kryptonium thompsoni]CUS84417.1 Uri superfamily endonuclease [Candidatus Kryptonium thompsoni]CUS87138.1 Uri superfamily endonuclease [Candidatus Kryptonium thompsoni]CUS89511.1 Uri superfamily endonuclease [Candidatus Kryptonium thompsoni]